MNLYNSLTKKIELFKPISDNEAQMYSCGPTVYDYVHIGNLRAYIFVDLLKRYLKYGGFNVKHVMNITDVDDKTIKASRAAGKSLKEYTDFYMEAFLIDLKDLNIIPPDVMPKATEHIEEMVSLIQKLIEKGYAYEAGGSVYFDISKFENYGELANIKKQDLKKNAEGRLSENDEYEKENANDFVLWKGWPAPETVPTPKSTRAGRKEQEDGDVFWETEIGKGRPGWHIECSAMSMKHLGETFDIHTGGIDLIFPHHTNEIAQSEAGETKKFVNYWLHNAHLIVEEEKMSKSLGNFYVLKDIKDKGFNPLLLRIILLKTHYRQTLNFSFSEFEEAKAIAERFLEFLINLDNIRHPHLNPPPLPARQSLCFKALAGGRGRKEEGGVFNISGVIKKSREAFKKAMDDDLNISSAFAAVFDFIAEMNKHLKNIGSEEAEEIKKYIFEIDSVFGFIRKIYELHKEKVKEALADPEIKNMLEERMKLRTEKKYEEADEIRKKLLERKIAVNDSADGGYTIRVMDVF